MARRPRCANCGKPLRATARTDARYCNRACKTAARRRRQLYREASDIGRALLSGQECELLATCPVCGTRFVSGHGHRRDAVYDRPACRQAAYRARRAEVTDPGPPSTALTSYDRADFTFRLVGRAMSDITHNLRCRSAAQDGPENRE